MTLKYEFPTDEDEIIELAKNIIKGMTDNPNFPNPPIPMSELQKMLDKAIESKEAEAAALEAERLATEKAEAAREKLYSAQRKMREYNRKHGIYDDNTPLVASGMPGLADRVFSQLEDQEDNTLQVQKKDND
ncbi:hypothetical protein [Candidatus Electrothrix sp.]|uniref:hypothetical protein n=1 Tax=Candidatus Electrothrix sp. TaxID=2170559 RepID=UPI0040567525